MLKYKHVLLATDLSKNSHTVAKRAKQIAEESQAKLSIVHVLEHSPVAYGGEFSIPIEANLNQTLEANAREALAKLASKYDISDANIHLESGSVKLAVSEIAEKNKVDLIVVGTHGHQAMDFLLGSRANAILHVAKCDVLVIKIKD